MFFWNIIILIGVIDESSHHFSFDTHLNQDCHRASRYIYREQQFVDRPCNELVKTNEFLQYLASKR